MNVAFFGSSLVSAYWNGAATYYRGVVRALHRRGHAVTFYEPDAWGRQEHRDLVNPDYATVVVWKGEDQLRDALAAARSADLVVKASGIGVEDARLEADVLELRSPRTRVVFWDVDAPATLARVAGDPHDAFRACIPAYDLVFTYGGGPPVVAAYLALGARRCVPIYNGLDPDVHRPVRPDPRFAGALAFLGNRLPDREDRVERMFLEVARRMPDDPFVLGGNGWGDKALPPNVRWVGHVYTADHNAFNCTPRAVLNLARESMAAVGWSPATRVFEAAGAAACLLTDRWAGLDEFFRGGEEVLVADSADAVVEHLRSLDDVRRRQLGLAARYRALREHTYAQRAERVEAALRELG